ncbi:MAG: hypothetical protein K6G26_10440 [Lachnospiraceae bacterium]|nr:hypothetical protein [Lachnospiraceae bacterium]
MKKGLLYVVLAGVLLTGCNDKDKADDSKKDSKGQNDIKYEYLSKIKKSDKVDNIKRVRDEIEEDISELATGKYVNLYKGDFDVVFTENDELHVLDVKQKDEYLYGEELKNRLEYIISCAKEGMNYEAKSEEFMFSMNMISSDDYNEISLSKENLDKIANGKYNDYFSGMVYFLGNSETDACFQSTPDYRAVFVGGNYLTDKGYDSIIESQYAFNDNKNKECIYKYSEKANQSKKMISGEKTCIRV